MSGDASPWMITWQGPLLRRDLGPHPRSFARWSGVRALTVLTRTPHAVRASVGLKLRVGDREIAAGRSKSDTADRGVSLHARDVRRASLQE